MADRAVVWAGPIQVGSIRVDSSANGGFLFD